MNSIYPRCRSKRKQATLFKFGLSRTINHRSEEIDVSGPDYCDDIKGTFKCDVCDQYFKSRQGLSVHKGWSHQRAQACSSNMQNPADALKIGLGLMTDLWKNDVNEEHTKEFSGTECSVIKDTTHEAGTLASNVSESKDPNKEVADEGASTKARRDTEKRRKYDFIFKVKVIEQLDEVIPGIDVAFNLGIDKSPCLNGIKSANIS